MKYCSFFGHRDFFCSKSLEKLIKGEIANCVEKRGICNFLLGGYGGYDSFCAKCVKDMKEIYPQIKSYDWKRAFQVCYNNEK